MTRVNLGLLLGVAFGIADVVLMLPLSFPDKRAALLGAFCARFALGFFAATVRLPVSPVASGLLVGILTSVPDAIITKAYAPKRRSVRRANASPGVKFARREKTILYG